MALPEDPALVLLLAVQRGDQEAMGRLYDQYGAALYGVILKVVGGTEQAEEVLQDCFLKIWRASHTYDVSKGRVFTWMLNIARNTAIDLVRTAGHRAAEKIQSLDATVYRMGTDDDRARIEHLGMDKVLSLLKPEHKEMIDMAYYQGWSQQEIAERTGLPLGTVKSRTRAALLSLKEHLVEPT